MELCDGQLLSAASPPALSHPMMNICTFKFPAMGLNVKFCLSGKLNRKQIFSQALKSLEVLALLLQAHRT